MLTKRTVITSLVVIFIVMLSLLGCTKQPAGPKIEPPGQQQPHEPPQNSTEHNIEPNQPTETDNGDKDEAHISSPIEEGEGDDAQPDEQSPELDPIPEPNAGQNNNGNPQLGEVSPYNPNKPMLIGLTIAQSKDRIKEKFGAPIEEYVMEDPLDPITVYEYPGFLVGYDKNQLIAFIDINSKTINPGLNGLKLGDSIDAAVKALGSPDTRTAYVMNYHSLDATLKLDIDPHTQTISSIKLFGASDS